MYIDANYLKTLGKSRETIQAFTLVHGDSKVKLHETLHSLSPYNLFSIIFTATEGDLDVEEYILIPFIFEGLQNLLRTKAMAGKGEIHKSLSELLSDMETFCLLGGGYIQPSAVHCSLLETKSSACLSLAMNKQEENYDLGYIRTQVAAIFREMCNVIIKEGSYLDFLYFCHRLPEFSLGRVAGSTGEEVLVLSGSDLDLVRINLREPHETALGKLKDHPIKKKKKLPYSSPFY